MKAPKHPAAFNKVRLPLAVMISLSCAQLALAQSEKVQPLEEILITGSLLENRSDQFSFPVKVMAAEEISAQGTPNLGDVLRNSTFNFGVESVGNILGAEQQTASLQQ